VTDPPAPPPSPPSATAPAGGWHRATVRAVAHPTPSGVILRLEVPDRTEHWPGQHYVVRLTADDGYTAQRSYSIASAPSDPLIELFVERLEDGEVSSYLADGVAVGDELDVRGPIGGWFVWRGDVPAVGIAGGSGVVPLVAMLRHAAELGRPDLLRLVVSARTIAAMPYATELAEAGALLVVTREPSPSGRPAQRVTGAELASTVDGAAAVSAAIRYFVCGSAGFAEATSTALVECGVPVASVRVERFGPTA
jgi:ferredoxin-NADP reductase